MQICRKLFAVLLLIVSIWKVSSGSLKSNEEDQQNEIIANKTVESEEKIKFLVNRITEVNQQLEDYKDIIKNVQNEVSNEQGENEKLKSQLQKITNETNKDEVASNNSTSKNEEISESTTISKSLPSSCVNMTAGIQEIQIGNAKPFKAMCDGDGWMIIQRRINGTEDFNRTWQEYEDGFGDLNKEFWFGLEKIHLATSSTRQRLNMTIRSGWGADPFVIHFDDFRIGNSESFYKLESIGNYTEDWHTRSENLLKNNVNNAFSTYDANHNGNPELNCGSYGAGGFWFSFDCLDYNMNEPTDGYWTTVLRIRPYTD